MSKANEWKNPYKINGADLNKGIARHGFEEVTPYEFYRDIFGHDELDEQDAFTEGKYTGIALEVTRRKNKNGSRIVKRHTITDDLDTIDELTYSNNFCLMSPISYAGKKRTSKFARHMYALCIEVDSLVEGKENKFKGLDELFGQCQHPDFLPTPTYVVTSGNGIHLYYVWEKPVPLFKNVAKSMAKYKKHITKRMWNRYVTTLYEPNRIQYESIFQAFRMPGTLTKRGLKFYEKYHRRQESEIVRVYKFKDAKKVSIEYMNSFVKKAGNEIVEIYKSDLTLAQAKQKYPEWYQKRIIEKKPRSQWECDRAVYDWWKNRILNEGEVGHRYYCMMCLSIYAIKCGTNITYEELEKDAFEIMEHFQSLTVDPENEFTEKDVMDALQIYEDRDYVTYPINSIANRSGIHIEKNARNGRKRKEHLHGQWMKNDRPTTNICKSNREMVLQDMREKGEIMGRPSKQKQVAAWRQKNPFGIKAECIKELGIDKKTVYKWWDSIYDGEEVEQAVSDTFGPELMDLLKEIYADDEE